MHFSLRIFLVFFFFAFLIKDAMAQYGEAGFNFGLTANRYSVSANRLSENLVLRQGNLKIAPRLGGQIALKGMPDKYRSVVSGVQQGLMLELSGCRCGGKTELVIEDDFKTDQIVELDYITWQADFSILYMLKINRTRLITGPTVTMHTYRGVSDPRFHQGRYVYTQGQIGKFYVGYEFGLGYRYEDFLFSARYHTNITSYGEPTGKVPADYGIHQARIVFSYFLFEKRLANRYRGLYF